jgi:anti-sigma regulatory factor (Ser/Thr protein kinase)
MVYAEARDELVATAGYQPVPAAAAAARRFVRDTLHSWELASPPAERGGPAKESEPAGEHGQAGQGGQDTLVDDAVLLTSELVTNAVLHAGTPVQVTCRLLGDASDGAVEIAVLDRRPGQLRPDLPHTAAEAAERTSGRGLQLPSELASAWGVTYARAAKAVWFRLELAGRGRPVASGTSVAAVPGQPAATRAAAQTPAGPDIPAPRPAGDPGTSRFDALLVRTVESARDTTGADTAYVLHAGRGSHLPVRAAAAGGHGQLAEGTAGLAASAARALAKGALSLVTVPLIVDGTVTGVLAAAAAEPGRFSENDASRLQDLADRCAPALERARLSSAGPA